MPLFTQWSEWSNCTNDTDSYRFRVRECLRRDKIACRSGELIQYEICANLSGTVNAKVARDEILELSG